MIEHISYNDDNLCAGYQGLEGLRNQNAKSLSLKANDFRSHLFNVFPNPTKGQLTIQYEYDLSSIATIHLVDMDGKIVLQDLLEPSIGQKVLALDRLPSGIYQLVINSDERLIHTERIVVIQ